MTEEIKTIDDLFGELEVPNPEEAVNQTSPKTTNKKKSSVKKETAEAQEVQKQVKTSKKEHDFDPDSVVVIDLKNFDDRKKVADYLYEGKILLTDQSRPFIVAIQNKPEYNPMNPPAIRIMCDEVEHVKVVKYYMDLALLEPESRTKIREAVWCHHRGYTINDVISHEQLDYLLEKGFISEKQVFYTHIDVSTGRAYSMNNDPSDPSLAFIQEIDKDLDKMEAAYKTGSNSKLSSLNDIDVKEIKEPESTQEAEPETEIKAESETESKENPEVAATQEETVKETEE